MGDYQKVVDALQKHEIAWSSIDRLVLNDATYEDFQERASFKTSNYATNDAPAVRRTTGTEKIVYVSDSGVQMTIEL